MNTKLKNKHLEMIFDMLDKDYSGWIDLDNLAQISYEAKEDLNIKTIK